MNSRYVKARKHCILQGFLIFYENAQKMSSKKTLKNAPPKNLKKSLLEPHKSQFRWGKTIGREKSQILSKNEKDLFECF